ncbi:FAD binding domain-containing protein [Saccharomonospora piscinae]|uniref:Carbon monoxide dehydrogenase n=1 Tax=Saccharomonospora piscinae TaxID=687388 RepID=A0A1V9A2C4_SACPI|nr:xanthine dehydrogenase family protein subunit M [Saccharomonospora piscinae]OQO91166.1 carbon monoxide dehydrogenase [Saccharomonospora piscinae]TLW93865.1 xanthine dehydrogenase family protein subunit M [Saccharomonospora piscinae]
MQVPAQFQYEKATSVEHALTLLDRYGEDSVLVAGGHSLLPMMKLRLAQPETLIDINDVAELGHIGVDRDAVTIGAMVRHADLLASPVIGEHFPILTDAERVIADPAVRHRGTVGGSLCQADPSEDLAAAFVALDADALVRGPGGERTVPVREFFAGPYETVLDPGELLVALRVPIRSSASAYEKVERRSGDWAVASAGAALRLDDGHVAWVGLGLTAVGAPGFGAPEAERFLVGGEASEQRFAEAGRIAAEHCNPMADQRGPVDYKRHLAATLTARALRRAASRWRGHRTHEES